ncbi:MAG: hypothetical protein AAF686_06390 [Pseudomonadota bacterium]
MRSQPSTLFVGRRAYYRRRLADAARLMPLLGVGLFMFPLFWISPEGVATSGSFAEDMRASTVSVMVYIFVVWVALAAAAGLISRRLGLEPATDRSGAEASGRAGENGSARAGD